MLNLALVFAAGMASVLSPCVLPVVPIVVAGKSDEHRLRPLLTVAGLSLTFVIMGVLSSLFGSLLGPRMIFIEKVAGVLILLMGALLLLEINLFIHLSFFSRFAQKSKGRAGGFLLGAILGIVWIPCVGPMLSGVLSLVAARGTLVSGIGLLLVYSAGFAIPMLLAGYASQLFRNRLTVVKKHPRLTNYISGAILIGLGVFILIGGMTGINF